MARQVVDAAMGGGHSVTRPWLGIKSQALTGEMAKSLGLDAPQGVVVAEVWPGGPGAGAGLAQGDVVVSVDGQEVDDEAGLNYRIGTLRPGQAAQLSVRRNGVPARMVHATVEAPPAEPPPTSLTLTGQNPFAGATVINLSPAAAMDYGADPFGGGGVMVAKIDGGFAQAWGLRPGDFIRQINGRTIKSTTDVTAAVQSASGSWSLTVERAGRTITARFNG
jgi:S1-C subfamily serine protease